MLQLCTKTSILIRGSEYLSSDKSGGHVDPLAPLSLWHVLVYWPYGFLQKLGIPERIFRFFPIGSMYGIYGNIYHQYTPNVSIYTIHGSYGFLEKVSRNVQRNSNFSNHWIALRENLNRKPMGFYMFLPSNCLGFPVNFPIIQLLAHPMRPK